MKFRKAFVWLLAVGAAAVVVGIGVFYGAIQQQYFNLAANKPLSLPIATQFIPRSSAIAGYLSLQKHYPAFLQKFSGASAVEKRLAAETDQLLDTLVTYSGIDTPSRARSWLGDQVTLAVTSTDIDHNRSNGQQPGYLAVLSPSDQAAARAALEFFWQRQALAGTSLIFEQFAGAELVHTQQSSSLHPQEETLALLAPLATAIVADQFLLLANDISVLRQALVSMQSKSQRLIEDPRYQEVMANLSGSRLGGIFINVPQSLDWLQLSSLKHNFLQAEPSDGVFDRIMLSLKRSPTGILVDTAVAAAGGHTFPLAELPSLGIEPLTQRIPADAPFVLLGNDIYGLWTTISHTVEAYIANSQPFQQMKSILGLELPDESYPLLLEWLRGKYVASLISMEDDNMASEWMLLAERQPNAEEALLELEQIAQQQNISKAILKLPNSHDVEAWIHVSAQPGAGNNRKRLELKTRLAALHKFTEGYDIFTKSVTTMNQMVDPQPSLSSQPDWLAAVEPLESVRSHLLYLDWPVLRPELLQRTPWLRVIDTVASSFLDAVKSLSVSSYGGDDHIQRSGIFIQLRDRK